MKSLSFSNAASALMLFGCLDEPPTYVAPDQIPPFIITSQVTPSPNAVFVMEEGSRMEIDVPFRSEDLGERVRAIVVMDLAPGEAPSTIVDEFDEPASTFDDDSRSFSAPVRIIGTAGCHSVTLLASQSSTDILENYNGADDRIASLTWWVNVLDPQGERELLENCISRGTESAVAQ